VGGPESGLDQSRPVTFTELVELPLVVPRSPTGIGSVLENAALRAKVKIDVQSTTDSLQVSKSLIEAGLVYGVLPRSACRREIDSARLRFAPVIEPSLAQQLGVGATSQLELPSEFTAKVGSTIREEVSSLVKSGRWHAFLWLPDETHDYINSRCPN